MQTINKVGRRYGDLSDLPEHLLKELHISKGKQSLETQIIEVFKALDGVANIDEILVGLFRQYQVTSTRPFIATKLYRMTKKNLISSVRYKKGIYKLEDYDANR